MTAIAQNNVCILVQEFIFSLVKILLTVSSPTTIIQTIRTTSVNSIKSCLSLSKERNMLRVRFEHITEKVVKVTPTLTNLYTFSAVSSITRLIDIITPTFHSGPNSIKSCLIVLSVHSVSKSWWKFNFLFTGVTPTADCATRKNTIDIRLNRPITNAMKQPHRLPSRLSYKTNSSKPINFLSYGDLEHNLV